MVDGNAVVIGRCHLVNTGVVDERARHKQLTDAIVRVSDDHAVAAPELATILVPNDRWHRLAKHLALQQQGAVLIHGVRLEELEELGLHLVLGYRRDHAPHVLPAGATARRLVLLVGHDRTGRVFRDMQVLLLKDIVVRVIRPVCNNLLSFLKEYTNNVYSSMIMSFSKFNRTIKNCTWLKALG